ncbi:MAG TPA: phosphoribosylamine--glycine ligase [Gemmatimonadaceae bacterium]
MKLLLVGSGGREHAVAWKLRRDDPSLEIICAPGNAGISEIGECIPVKATDVRGLLAFARRGEIDLTFVGPEAPLASGIVDLFREERLTIFGPTRAAAEIETSKRFAKELMRSAGVPTAEATSHISMDSAKDAARKVGAPVVVKASGLAAGKGVIVASSLEEAERAIEIMMGDRAFGDAGAEVLVEEFLEGEELSLFGITDGETVVPLLAAQDHKRLLDGDLGPNTGGMGAYAPVSIATADLVDRAIDIVFNPTLRAMRAAGRPFTGLLYAGLMITGDKVRVVEFNCRFGDPETQAILPLMQSSLLDLVMASATGEGLGAARIVWDPMHSVTTVVAAPGYPDSPQTGAPIRLPAPPAGVTVFHAGTSRDSDTGELITAGGRVLAVTGVAPSLAEAAEKSRSFAEKVTFEGRQLRRDIGWRELERSARAS